MSNSIIYLTTNILNEYSSETYHISELVKKYKVHNYQYKYFIKKINNINILPIFILISLKEKNVNYKLIREKYPNIKLIGYTWDLISYTIIRKHIMERNIKNFDYSFIVEDNKKYKNKALQIFNPTKCEEYIYSLPINSIIDEIKIIHFGRINDKRLDIIKYISTLSKITIDIYTSSDVSNLNIKNINIFPEVCGKKIYDITNHYNTLVLSINEVVKYKYYSNRITMMCGYRCCIIQEYFDRIFEDFNKSQMLIWKNKQELRNVINRLRNNYSLQLQLKQNAYNISKLYSYTNFSNFILNNIN